MDKCKKESGTLPGYILFQTSFTLHPSNPPLLFNVEPNLQEASRSFVHLALWQIADWLFVLHQIPELLNQSYVFDCIRKNLCSCVL